MVINQKAWDLLSSDEKMALSLHHGLEKSSWQVGEIMNKSHYKYLEIKYRAEQFLKMFTDHIETFDCLIPKYITGDRIVIGYFRKCLEERKKPLLALQELSEDYGRVLKSNLNERIIKTLKEWEKEENPYNKEVMHLIKEFDRWNNFRILPKEIQEPSAFKRRIKNSYKRQLKTLNRIHPLAIEKIRKTYVCKKGGIYLPLLTPLPELLMIRENINSKDVMNSIGLYMFQKKADAMEYISAVYHYTSKQRKECQDGLEFWPTYRELIKKAKNYNDVMKISSSRKYLQLAMQKLNYI